MLERDQAEIRRSQLEAKSGIATSEVKRYLNPPSNTAFSLEYAFSLLGDIQGKRVLDIGCGSGENIPALVYRGGEVIGLDISHELVELAKERLSSIGLAHCAQLYVASAYQTGLPDKSIDIIFSMSLVHHLDIAIFRKEMRRILRSEGFIVFKEPIAFNGSYRRLRTLPREHKEVSEYEHPLTKEEFKRLQEGFEVDSLRFFRLPFVGLAGFISSMTDDPAWIDGASIFSTWIIKHFPQTLPYTTSVVMRMKL